MLGMLGKLWAVGKLERKQSLGKQAESKCVSRKQVHRQESKCASHPCYQANLGKRYTLTIEIPNAYAKKTRNIPIILQILRISSIATMNPFIHLPDYRVIVCAGPRCKYVVLPIHVDSHLGDARHNYSKEQWE